MKSKALYQLSSYICYITILVPNQYEPKRIWYIITDNYQPNFVKGKMLYLFAFYLVYFSSFAHTHKHTHIYRLTQVGHLINKYWLRSWQLFTLKFFLKESIGMDLSCSRKLSPWSFFLPTAAPGTFHLLESQCASTPSNWFRLVMANPRLAHL